MSWGEYITGASGLMGHYNKIEQAGIFAKGSKFEIDLILRCAGILKWPYVYTWGLKLRNESLFWPSNDFFSERVGRIRQGA